MNGDVQVICSSGTCSLSCVYFWHVLFCFLLVSSGGIWMVDSPQPGGLGKKALVSQR